jgi:2-aminoadipate transaminase
MDEEGMNTDALAELLSRLERTGELERLRLIYVCDYYQNPSGRTLSLSRRQHLVELVRRYSRKQRILILEDAAYRELRYDGPDLPSVKSLDRENQFVILAMTFSKPLAPGLKTGYGFLPRDLTGPLLRLKGNHDFGSNNLAQHLLDRLVASGAYDRHVAELCRVYRAKRDVMLDTLAAEFRGSGSPCPGLRWTHPDGGLYVWLTFPSGIETGQGTPLMLAALREGILYVPGEFCYVKEESRAIPNNEVRLSFGVASAEQIREAVLRLAGATAAILPANSESGTEMG